MNPLKHLARAVLVLLLLFCCLARAQQPAATEDEVKAAFLYKFLDFVQWPADARAAAAIVIGVMNDAAVEVALRRYVELKRDRGPTVVVRSIASPEQADGVHILFIGRRENARLPRILAGVKGKPVLVVTDSLDALERGAIINFIVTDRVRFEIAIDNAAQAGLHLNARLLSVAVRVKKSEGMFQPTLFADTDAGAPFWCTMHFSCGSPRRS